MEWVVSSRCFREWALHGDQGRLEWELKNSNSKRVPLFGDGVVCETSGVAVPFVVFISRYIGVLRVSMVGRGQLGKVEACMQSKDSCGCCKIRFSPCMATSPRVNPVGISNT